MAFVIKDRVRETSTTTGTGTLTLLGAVSGFQAFSNIGNTNTTYYTIANQNAAEWECGIGTYTLAGTTLARTTVISSSNAGALVNFSAGTKDVFCSPPSIAVPYIVGQVSMFAMNSAPTGFLKCEGQAISRTTYAGLFAQISTTYGVGDGSTTFNIPELRGEFLRCLDNGRGIDVGRALGSAQAQDLQPHTHTTGDTGTGLNGSIATTGATVGVVGDGPNVTGSTGTTETRPRNVALVACIYTGVA